MKLRNIISFFIVLIIFNGCGSGGNSGATSENKTKIGLFSDSLVDGIEYKCGSISGITGDIDGKGSFKYQEDCTVKFSIGKIHLGEMSGSDISSTNNNQKVFITNILGLNTTNTNDTRVWNISRLLQTLDLNNDPSDGIFISSIVRDNLNQNDVISLDFTQIINENDLNNTVIKADSNNSLITITKALAHFESTLRNNNYNIDTVSPAVPFLTINLTKIKTINTIKKVVEINGEEGSKILLGFNSDGNSSNITYIDQNLTIDSSWKQNLELNFNNDTFTHFHYYIKLEDDQGHQSNTLHLNVLKDFTPPHVTDSVVAENVPEEQKLFKNINATDSSGEIGFYEVVDKAEDNRSKDDELFEIDTNGSVTFIDEPNYDDNIGVTYQLVARAVDEAGNMTDVLLKIILENILDNPPQLTATNYSVSRIEMEVNNTEIYDLNTTIEHNLSSAPDNDPTLSPINFILHNRTDIFDLNKTTGRLTIKDNTDPLFDYEQSPNTIDLNISIENNNTKVTPNGDLNITYTTLTINVYNKMDTTPSLNLPTLVSIYEHNNAQGIIKTITKDTPNCDYNTTMTFSIQNGNDGNFTINTITGAITRIGDTLDYETTTQYILTVRATNTWWNNSTHYDEVNLTINIDNVIDNPPVIVYRDLNNSIPESTLVNFQVAQLETNGTIYDENQTISYTLISMSKNGNNLASNFPFSVNNSGVVATSRQLLSDYTETLNKSDDTIFNLQLHANNTWWDGSSPDSNTISLDINVTNVIDNFPVLKQISSQTHEENSSTPIGTTIATVEANGTIYDENNATKFYIKTGDTDDKFDINITTGVITIKNLLDWETSTSYALQLVASNTYYDGIEHNSSEITLNINITNKIEKSPKIKTPSVINIHENTDADTIIAFIETNSSEVDELNISNITIKSGNDGNFSIEFISATASDTNLAYAKLKIANHKALNYDSNNSYSLEINATNEYNSTIKTIPINILDDVDTNLSLLVLLVEYNDINFTTSYPDIENLIFTNGGGDDKYLLNYFSRISKNKFTFKPANETFASAPLTDGIIKIKLNRNHPQNSLTQFKQDIKDAIIISDNNCTYSLFDNNNDGNISSDELQILLLVAGGERSYGDDNKSINAISDSITSIDNNITLDGVTLKNNYAAIGELINTKKATIGLIAKHISEKLFGFKQDSNINYIYNYYDLMGDGFQGHENNETLGRTPVHPSIFNKIQEGWVTPRIFRKGTTSDIELYNTHDNSNFNAVKIDTDDSNIYYLIENRNQTDQGTKINYDNGFYGINNSNFSGGLIIWKINNSSNTINMINISNSSDNIFRDTNNTVNDLPLDIRTNIFEFNDPGTVESSTKKYSIQIEVKP